MKNKKEINLILDEGEGLKIEFKESFDSKSLAKDVEKNILIKVGSTASAYYELKSSAKFGKVRQSGK